MYIHLPVVLPIRRRLALAPSPCRYINKKICKTYIISIYIYLFIRACHFAGASATGRLQPQPNLQLSCLSAAGSLSLLRRAGK